MINTLVKTINRKTRHSDLTQSEKLAHIHISIPDPTSQLEHRPGTQTDMDLAPITCKDEKKVSNSNTKARLFFLVVTPT